MNDDRTRASAGDLITLAISVVLLVTIVVGLISCGDDDLLFPGDVPFTETSEPEDTATPDDN